MTGAAARMASLFRFAATQSVGRTPIASLA